MSTGLMPTKSLGATYDSRYNTLNLTATGSVQPNTDNIHFVRQPWLGGLMYELVGTTYAVMGKPQDYTVEQPEVVTITPFPRDVIIKTSEHPNGVPVPIYWLLEEGKPDDTVLATGQTSAEGKAPPTEVAAPADNSVIYVPKGGNFQISHNAGVPAKGSVTIDYDAKRLRLVTASIQDNLIVWTFQGNVYGQTEVVVTVYGGIATFVMRISYKVDVIAFPNDKE